MAGCLPIHFEVKHYDAHNQREKVLFLPARPRRSWETEGIFLQQGTREVGKIERCSYKKGKAGRKRRKVLL